MDYEKKYNEALNWMRELYPGLHGATKEDAEHYFPELRESEDERIRKWLADYFSSIKKTVWIHRDITCEQILGWLEKQKEPTTEELYAEAGTTEKEYIANTMKMVRAMRETKKEQKPNYCHYGGDPNVERCKYCSAACSARLTEEQKPAEKQDYSGLNDLERAIHRGFLAAGVENVPVTIIKETAKECLAEMKPAEWSEEDEKILNELLDHCNTENATWYNWLKRLRSQPKKGLHPGSIRKVDNPMKWMEEDEKEREQKPVAWSEEDEKMLDSVIQIITHVDDLAHEPTYAGPKWTHPYTKEIAWLKSLRPSWKPSEEQMEALEIAFRKDGDDKYRSAINSLYNDLKKL